MRNPIKVIGKDIHYTSLNVRMYIDGNNVIAAHPIFATRAQDGQLWRCVPDHDDAELVAYKLKCVDGALYDCSDQEELQKIGLSLTEVKMKQSIGLIHSEQDDEKSPI